MRVVRVALARGAELLEEAADAAEQVPGLASDGSEEQELRAGKGEGQMDGLRGGGLGFSGLAGGEIDDSRVFEIEELGLAWIWRETEVLIDPGRWG